jgi:hypothetical protein
MVCQLADEATRASEEVATTVLKAKEKLISLEEKATECNDLTLGDQLVYEAKQWLQWVQQITECGIQLRQKFKFGMLEGHLR